MSASTIHGTHRSEGRAAAARDGAVGVRRRPFARRPVARRRAGRAGAGSPRRAAASAGGRSARRAIPVRRCRVRPRVRDRSGGGSFGPTPRRRWPPCYGPTAGPTQRELEVLDARTCSPIPLLPITWRRCERRPRASTPGAARRRLRPRRRPPPPPPAGPGARPRVTLGDRATPSRPSRSASSSRSSRPPSCSTPITRTSRAPSWCSSARPGRRRSSPGWPWSPGARGVGSLRSDFGLVLRRPGRRGSPTLPGSSPVSGCSSRRCSRSGCSTRLYGHAAKQDVVKTADRALRLADPLVRRWPSCCWRRSPRSCCSGARCCGQLLRRITPGAAVFVIGRGVRCWCTSWATPRWAR